MISAQIRAQVRQRAQNACEYCHLHQDDSPLAALHVEIPLSGPIFKSNSCEERDYGMGLDPVDMARDGLGCLPRENVVR